MSTTKALRSAARYYAVQALFQMEAADQNLETVRQQFWSHRFGETFDEGEMQEADTDLFDAILHGVIETQAKIDQMTNAALDAKWPIDRIDPTLRAICRAAGAEFIVVKTPPRVVIDEYVELTKDFSGDAKQGKFINAVLDSVAKTEFPDL
ncbi:MAG: transcription antitermination factor NusB [Pseudomonadota bacterium]